MVTAVAAQIFFESNSFNTVPTGADDFVTFRGDEIIKELRGSGSIIGGVLARADKLGIEVTPAIAAYARPGGPLRHDVFEALAAPIVDAVTSQKPDVVLLDLHGSMTTTESEDPEGDLLARIRRAAGDGTVIAAGHDLHGTVTTRMLENADLLVACKFNPHSDFHETGRRITDLALATSKGDVRPITYACRVPMLLAGNNETGSGPLRDFKAMADAALASDETLLDVSIFNAMPLIDAAESAQTILVVSNGKSTTASDLARHIGSEFWRRRAEFVNDFLSADEVLETIAAHPSRRPYVVSDFGDRILAGAPGDGVELITAALKSRHGLRGVVPVTDPHVVQACIETGEAQTVTVKVGGLYSDNVEPIEVQGIVERTGEGVYRAKGPLFAGQEMRCGHTAIVRVGSMRIVATERAAFTQDVNFFESLGTPVASQDFVVVKSGHHFQLSFDGIATPIKAGTQGIGAYKPGVFDVKRKPLYPEVGPAAVDIAVEVFERR